MSDSFTAKRNLGIRQNVQINIYDEKTKKLVQRHTGHNAATNSLLLGIGYYLAGYGVLNQGGDILKKYVPQYISLGTLGLISQDTEETTGLPAGIGGVGDTTLTSEATRFSNYMTQCPGFGADGYDANENNSRIVAGLGPKYSGGPAVGCELITDKYLRMPISYRDIIPAYQAEIPKTIDIVFSGYVPTGALASYRNGNTYLFITEAGLWSRSDYVDLSPNDEFGENGLLAGYRIVPPDSLNWDMTQQENRDILKSQIIRVERNQVVQVIWKIQLGALEQLLTASGEYGDIDELMALIG